jgi:hypothetical protein
MNHRNRALLDLAHRVHECMSCGQWSEMGCEPAHENGIEAGKGFGIKGHDCRHAALCHSCHAEYDSGRMNKIDKAEMWRRAHMRTMDHYWQQGWVKVA